MESHTMATEAPLLHHSQCTAGEDLSATGSRNGFNGTGQFLVMAFTADRSVIRAAGPTTQPAGILQNDPISGFVADIGFLGVTKIISGTVTSIVAGSGLIAEGSSGGRVVVMASAGTNIPVGYALETPSAINNVITCMVFPYVLS
jgi:hypothetical protein